jgi:hypothetical protein
MNINQLESYVLYLIKNIRWKSVLIKHVINMSEHKSKIHDKNYGDSFAQCFARTKESKVQCSTILYTDDFMRMRTFASALKLNLAILCIRCIAIFNIIECIYSCTKVNR